MPFPESPRVVFRENPLVEVICQLRFPTVLAIAASPPTEFQEAIRSDYPIYTRQEGAQTPPEIASILGQLQIPALPAPPEAVNHRFESEDGNRIITLATNFVAVTERKYERWELFWEEIERARSALETIYRPSFYDRLGLRYQDVISRERLGLQGVEWSDLLNPAISGLLSSPQEIRESVRSVRGDSLLAVDGSGSVRLQHGLVQSEGSEEQVYLFDADFFTEERISGDELPGTLDLFNRQAGHLFRWAITDRLRDALGPTELV